MNRLTLAALLVWVGLGCSMTTSAQPFETVYAFGNGPANPLGNLTLGTDGNFYGTASGGQYGGGTVFRVSTNGNLMTLANFGSSFFTDGTGPFAGLTLGADGNFYGTTIAGGTNQISGTNNTGTIFRVTTNGTLTTVVSFTGFNGSYPECQLIIGPNGSFYGTTAYGGTSNAGTVFQATTNGILTTLASFSGTNGAMPQAGLTLGLDGNFYGTTTYGGISNYGTVFQVTPGGSLKTLVYFNNTNGAAPYGQLRLGSDGGLYGTTFSGGISSGPFQVTTNSSVGPFGTVFRVTTNGTLTTLIDLTFYGDYGGIYPGLASAMGWNPYGQLIQGANGHFYGTTSGGGANGSGTVFEVSTNGTLAQLAGLPNLQYILATNSVGTVYVNYTTNNWTNTLVAVDLNASITKLYDFPPLVNSTNSTGADSHSGLTLGPDGNFYSAVFGGGASGYGTIIRVATNGTTTALASFSGNTGSGIRAGLTLGPDGSLYGAAQSGGVNGYGTLFRWSPNGSLSTLRNFDYRPDGANPYASLTLGPDGNIYGTAMNGGTNLVQVGPNSYNAVSDGTVFRVTTNGVFTPVVYFNGTNGANPYGALTLLGDGSFYGTTAYGGISNSGTVFQLTTNGTLTVLGSFTGANGSHPDGKLTVGPNGHLYGTTVFGGVSNVGTVFEVSTQGIINTVLDFTGTNGANPQAGLLWNSDGYFYGTTDSGGSKHLGTVFKLTPGGALTTLVNFGQTNGDFPDGDLIQGPDGNLYGATSQGGGGFNGTVFRLNADGTMTTLFSFPSTPLNSSFSSGFHPYGGLILFTNGNFIDLYGTAFGGGNNGGGTIFQVNVATYYAVTENTSSLLNPLTNDTVWTTGGVLGLLTAVATNGTAQISGSGIDFTPTTNFTGTATISYTVTDNAGGTNASFITILVTNIPPLANPDFYAVGENTTSDVLSPLVNDQPVISGGVLGMVSVSATNGAAAISGTNVLFTPQTDFTGTATIGYTITDNIGGTNTSLITVQVTNVPVQADLNLRASAAPEPVGVKSNLVYSVTVSNAGPAAASGVVVSNRLPASVNFVSATGGATPSGGVLLVNVGSLAAGATNLVQLIVTPASAGKVTNVFQVFANETDPVPVNNSATVVSTVTNAPVVLAPAVPGTPIAWTNPGGAILLTYSLGFGGNPVPIQAGAGTLNPASTGQAGDLVLLFTTNGVAAPTNWAAVVRFFNPADPTGSQGLAATYSQAFFATNFGGSGFNGFQLFPVSSFIPEGLVTTYSNGLMIFDTTYTQFGPVGGILTGQENIDVVSVFTLTSAVNITSPTSGQVISNAALTVTGTATNYINSAVTNVFVQLNGAIWTSATTANGWTNWSANVTLTPGSNSVSAYAVDGYGSFSPTNSVTFDYVPAPVLADLTLSASAAPEPVSVGSNLVYSLTVSNAGPATATGVLVSNRIPAGVNFVSATGGATPSGGVLLVNLGSLASNATSLAQITVQPVSAGKLTNLFRVFANETDPVLTNNSAAVVSTVTNTPLVAQADLKLTTSAAPEPVGVGSNLVYSISITNQGPNAATGVTVSNRIPVGVNFVSATGGATPSGGVLLVNLGSLASNATSLAQITVQPVSAGKITNLFRVFATETDPVLTNNSATVVSTVTNVSPPPVDVAVSITAAPNPVGVGAPLTYLVAVTNNSPTTATRVVVSNTLPPNVTLFSLLPSQGTASNHSGVVTFNVGSLSNGMAAILAIVVIPNAAGFLTNSDLAFSAQPDSQPANNSATNVTSAVTVPITNLVLTVLSSITLDPQTGLFEQQIEVSNGGPSTPSSVLVLISGLAANAKLYNATGITNGTPFVQSASPLGVGSNVIFLLEFYVPTRVAPASLTFTVQAGPPVIPPVVSGTIMNISRMIVLPAGSVLVEFSAVPGQIYAIQYSSDMVTWRTAVPAITAPANQVQWIDSGPPKTDSSPAQQPARYYRVVRLTAN